jgi:hypothetical protein
VDALDLDLTPHGPGCWAIREPLAAAAKNCTPTDPRRGVLEALAEIAAYSFDPDARPPLRPIMPAAGRRIDEFEADTLDRLKDVAPALPADLRARVRDVLWLARRAAEIDGARLMVTDYCDAAEALARAGSSARRDVAIARWRRAHGIARMLKWDEGVDAVRTRVRAAVKNTSFSADVRVHVADLSLHWSVDDARTAATLAEGLAEAMLASIGAAPVAWDWPRYALHVAAEACQKSAQADDARRLRIRRADVFLLQAQWLQDHSDAAPLVRAQLVEQAVVALRDAGAPREKVDEAHQRLLDVRRLGVAQMETHRGPSVDLTDHVARAEGAVRGRPFPDAIRALATLTAPPRVAAMRAHVIENRKRFPLSSLFPRVHLDREGRKIATTFTDLHDFSDAALEPDMFEWARTCLRGEVAGTIDPARACIQAEHAASIRDWLEFLTECPLVSPDNVRAVAVGLAAGLQGDLIVSASVLAPQLEHMIRRLVRSTGAISSTLSSGDGTQREAALSTMLEHPELRRVLGEDFVFDLRGLLDDPAGANVRNSVAHGLWTDDNFMSAEAMYLWYTTLRLITLVVVREAGASDDG